MIGECIGSKIKKGLSNFYRGFGWLKARSTGGVFRFMNNRPTVKIARINVDWMTSSINLSFDRWRHLSFAIVNQSIKPSLQSHHCWHVVWLVSDNIEGLFDRLIDRPVVDLSPNQSFIHRLFVPLIDWSERLIVWLTEVWIDWLVDARITMSIDQ